MFRCTKKKYGVLLQKSLLQLRQTWMQHAGTSSSGSNTKRDVFLMEAIRRGRTHQSYGLYLVSTRFFHRMQHWTFYVTMTFTILPFSPSFTVFFPLVYDRAKCSFAFAISSIYFFVIVEKIYRKPKPCLPFLMGF